MDQEKDTPNKPLELEVVEVLSSKGIPELKLFLQQIKIICRNAPNFDTSTVQFK